MWMTKEDGEDARKKVAIKQNKLIETIGYQD